MRQEDESSMSSDFLIYSKINVRFCMAVCCTLNVEPLNAVHLRNTWYTGSSITAPYWSSILNATYVRFTYFCVIKQPYTI